MKEDGYVPVFVGVILFIMSGILMFYFNDIVGGLVLMMTSVIIITLGIVIVSGSCNQPKEKKK